MTALVFLCAGLIATAPTETGLNDADHSAYDTARARAGRDAGAHVALALWCENHGLPTERLKHLALAVLNDPTNATARGLMGLVAYRGQWKRPEQVSDQVKADAALAAVLAEYNARRARAGNSAEAQWKLGLWCEDNGLKAEALAHFATVVRLDPTREPAWKRLGCKKVNGRWVTEAQVEAEKIEAEAQKQADKKWKPLLTKWRGWLGDKGKREEAEKRLAEVDDPRAVPSIWAVFATGTPAQQGLAVQSLGQIDAPGASRALALLAACGDSAEVRRRATETLKGRDPRDFVGPLIGLLRDPVKYEVRPVGGPGSPGALFVAGKQFNVRRLYTPPPMPNIPIFPGEPVGFDQDGLPVISRFLGPTLQVDQRQSSTSTDLVPNGHYTVFGHRPLYKYQEMTTVTQTTTSRGEREMVIPIGQLMVQYQMSALVAQEQLKNDVLEVESFNARVQESNAAVSQVLQHVTGQDQGQDRKAWSSWWVNQLGYASSPEPTPPVPTIVQNVPLAYLPTGVNSLILAQNSAPVTNTSVTSTISLHHNCFKAGTPVRTLSGLAPIETIRVGDQILAQDTTTGALGYQPVVGIFHNKPSPTMRIDLGSESIVATPIHRFWKAGQGWTMARDLKTGDILRRLEGTAQVVAVTSEPVQPVFNIEVASGQSFFVGTSGVLVHDNSLVRPVFNPFDAPRLLTASAGIGK